MAELFLETSWTFWAPLGFKSELVKVTGTHKKEYKRITYKGKAEITYKVEKLKKRFR